MTHLPFTQADEVPLCEQVAIVSFAHGLELHSSHTSFGESMEVHTLFRHLNFEPFVLHVG